MLVRFTAENYRCFREPVELSMVAAPLDSHPDHVVAGDIPLLKLAVIYGANASGKTNLARAMEVAQRIVLYPAGVGRPLPIEPYRFDAETVNKPSRFEFEVRIRGRYFAYGFVASAHRVEEEWLYETGVNGDACLFERDAGGFRCPGLTFQSAEDEQFVKFTAKGTLANRLFLAECRQRDLHNQVAGVEVITNLIRWFGQEIQVVFPSSKYAGLVTHFMFDRQFQANLGAILRDFDTGVEGLDLEETPINPGGFSSELMSEWNNNLDDGGSVTFETTSASEQFMVRKADDGSLRKCRLIARHGGERPARLELADESDGTRRLIDLAPAVLQLVKDDGVYVIDEFDRSLHPEIAHSLIANFLRYSAGGSGQLIVTTHETTLMRRDFLRPDEIWFVEKRPDAGSRLVSLAEYKSTGNGDLQADYLQGRYGGVPVIHDLRWLGGLRAPAP